MNNQRLLRLVRGHCVECISIKVKKIETAQSLHKVTHVLTVRFLLAVGLIETAQSPQLRQKVLCISYKCSVVDKNMVFVLCAAVTCVHIYNIKMILYENE